MSEPSLLNDALSDAAFAGFLNALLREWPDWQFADERTHRRIAPLAASVAVLPFPTSATTVFAPLRHRSHTGRHAYLLPLWMTRTDEVAEPVSFEQLVRLVASERTLASDAAESVRQTFMRRVLASAENLVDALDRRRRALPRLYTAELDFIAGEQALFLGHPVHPAPKSRDEFTLDDARRYCPEYGASFPLAWFAVKREQLAEQSADQAQEIALQLALSDPTLGRRFVAERLRDDEILYPLHPWQANHLRRLPAARPLFDDGRVRYLGEAGSPWWPTSSLRTLYAEHAPYMLKCSLSVRVTNSVRDLQPGEIGRGLLLQQILTGPAGRALTERFPNLHLLAEPGGMVWRADHDQPLIESALTFRDNPFRGAAANNVYALAALCEDHPRQGSSRLGYIVQRLAVREGIEVAEAADRWFERFLETAVAPLLLAQTDYGLLFGAHQQNLLVRLQDQYPVAAYYRDCQGTGFCREHLPTLLHGTSVAPEALSHVFDATTAARVVSYYLIVNNVFNVISSLAIAGAAAERPLLQRLRDFLLALRERVTGDPTVVDFLLTAPQLWSKRNFLVSLTDVNENTRTSDLQDIYLEFPNPLVKDDETNANDYVYAAG